MQGIRELKSAAPTAINLLLNGRGVREKSKGIIGIILYYYSS